MNKEKAMIELMASQLPREERQLNRLFEADAEIVPFHGGRLAFTTDEFSEEDLLRDDDPYTLGWNLAVGGISDILAAGGIPRYYAHSLTARADWGEEYLLHFARGVGDVLRAAGVNFIGGDFGASPVWRCTVSVIGEMPGAPLLRSGAKPGDLLYLTGRTGSGNLEAFLKLQAENKALGTLLKPVRTRFHLRLTEAAIVRRFATACIDTSDGVFNGVRALAEMSRTGFRLQDVPYIKAGAVAAKVFTLPVELLCLGECGEYELLFTIRPEAEKELLQAAEDSSVRLYCAGRMTEPGRQELERGGGALDLKSVTARARDYANVREYLRELITFLRS